MDPNQKLLVSEAVPSASELIDPGLIDGISKLIPVSLLRKLNSKQITGIGKMKVVLRVQNNRSPVPIAIVPPSPNKNLKLNMDMATTAATGQTKTAATATATTTTGQFFQIDKKKKQITLFDPNQAVAAAATVTTPVTTNDLPRKLPLAPKMFVFDAIFTSEDSQKDVCSSALNDIIHAVIEGNDGCLFCLGQADIGKSFTMFGQSKLQNCYGDSGAIFFTIVWLFRCVSERQAKTGTKFTIRVSAIEISGPTNVVKDLLADDPNDPLLLPKNPTQFQNANELHVPNVEQAIVYLIAALKKRSSDTKKSHFLFSIHLDQATVNGVKLAAARSRLHLLDIGSCLSLAGLGNILLAIFNGQKHVPHRDHRLTNILKECLGSLTCQVSIIVHVSSRADSFHDTLTTLQLASRIFRIRRRRFKFLTSNNWSNFDDQSRLAMLSNSEPDPSSSDFSADTVIYLGPTTDDATDNEHPPTLSAPNQLAAPKTTPHPIQSPHKSYTKLTAQKSPLVTKKPSFVDDEKWIDGPKISKQKLANAQKLFQATKSNETWIDGPQSPKKSTSSQNTYGFMDTHKKTMIRQWIETQTRLVLVQQNISCHSNSNGPGSNRDVDNDDDDDDDEVPIPPPLPLITPLSCTNSREASIDDLMLKEKRWEQLRKQEQCLSSNPIANPSPVRDRSVQVTEQDIDYQKYLDENPLPESDQDSYENFRDVSADDDDDDDDDNDGDGDDESLTIVSTFTDSLSILNDFEKIFVNGQCDSIDRRTEQFLKKNQPVPTTASAAAAAATNTISMFGCDDIESLDRVARTIKRTHCPKPQPVLSPERAAAIESNYYRSDFHMKMPTFHLGNFAKIEPIKVEKPAAAVPKKHSPATVSRRAESGYHSSSSKVPEEDLDDDEDSGSVEQKQLKPLPRANRRPDLVRYHHHRQQQQHHHHQQRKKTNGSLCSWFLRPFTSKYIDSDGTSGVRQPDETHL